MGASWPAKPLHYRTLSSIDSYYLQAQIVVRRGLETAPVEAKYQMANPNLGTFNRAGTVADQASFDVGLRAHMVRVYNYMSSRLPLSGIAGFRLFSPPAPAGA